MPVFLVMTSLPRFGIKNNTPLTTICIERGVQCTLPETPSKGHLTNQNDRPIWCFNSSPSSQIVGASRSRSRNV